MFSSILSSILSSSSFSSKDVSLKTIGNYYNRFKYYNQSQENLENLNKFECLIPLKSGKEFKISNSKLILKNRIGSNSRYGLVYLTLFNNFKYATKLTPINKYNLNEIILVKKLSDITIQDLNPHFLLTYKLFICNNEFEIINLPRLIKEDNYYIAVNELVNGNFKNFIYDNSVTNSLLLNALQQIMISILSFHHFTDGYFHNDCHYKNFLFYKIKPGGYFHYKIYNKDIYVKNMGYLWLIWDFGLVHKEQDYKKRRFEDYFRILHFFLKNKTDFNDYKTLIIVEKLLKFKYTNFNIPNSNSDELFFNELCKIPQLFLFNKPPSAKIVNKKPYIIN